MNYEKHVTVGSGADLLADSVDPRGAARPCARSGRINHPRIAFVAGTLREGGAEKQLVYAATSLAADADVRVYSLTAGEPRERVLKEAGLPVSWMGRAANPAVRAVVLAARLRRFRPDIVQAGHFFVNLYVEAAGRASGAVPVGTMRSNCEFEVRANGRWGRWLLRVPRWLLANSQIARTNATARGIDAGRIYVSPNVIDLEAFDSERRQPPAIVRRPIAVTVCSLDAGKRVELFLQGVAIARRQVKDLTAVVVGDGPGRERLVSIARQLDLGPSGVAFLGHRSDVPAILAEADVFVLTSDDEGFPNVLLEAMAARLPIVTTPAGDAPRIVENGVSGFVVPFGDAEAIGLRLQELFRSPDRRQRFGAAGRRALAKNYSYALLRPRLLEIYAEILERSGRGSRSEIWRAALGRASAVADPVEGLRV